MIVSWTVTLLRRKSTCRGLSAISSPQRMPVSMAVSTISRYRSGIAAISRSNSAGVRVGVFETMTLGSSVCAHGLATTSPSRTARAKIECSMVWYLRIDLAESPPAAALVTQSWTRPGVIWCSCLRPKNGKKCLVRFDTYAALVVGSMCLDGSHSSST